jgi:hypothetical protein
LNYVIYYWLLQYLKNKLPLEKISLIRNKIIAKEITLLKLPEQNQTKKKLEQMEVLN